MNRLSCNKRGEQEVADYGTMTYPTDNTEVATGPKAVGEMASKFFHKVSEYNENCDEFDADFARRVSAGVRRIKRSHMEYGTTRDQRYPPTLEEVVVALKDAGRKLHKAAGEDGVCNWMLVWGGDTVAKGLHKLFEKVWTTKHLPKPWREGTVKFLHKTGSPQEISNYRPICLISVIGKVFTRSWLPRLTRTLVPNLPIEQGCGRKGQGSAEHLWAFVAMGEDVLHKKDVENTGEMYAMFADLHKCYDQVWRDGLYLSLYLQGVRGPMLEMIMLWLDSSEANTLWRGVRGPTVAQEQGLRQGCVLSPILFCAFANAFTLKAPTRDVPPELSQLATEFLGQGLQRLEGEACGINCPAIGRRFMSLMFMDDTTLMSSTLAGLKKEIQVYLGFCKKMRMRLNVKKSKLMHFTRKMTDQGGELGLEVEGKMFTTPKPTHKGEVVHKHLGMWLDQKLTGAAHLNRMCGAAKEQARALEVLANQNEELALLKVRTRLGPQFCHNMELVKGATHGEGKMRAAFTQAIGGALGVKQQVWEDGPSINKSTLVAETDIIPWDIQVRAQQVRLAGKLQQNPAPSRNRALNGELGKTLANTKMATRGRTSENSMLQSAVGPAMRWGVPIVRPAKGKAKEEWKKRVQRGAKADTVKEARESLRIRDSDPAQGGRAANMLHANLTERGSVCQEAKIRRKQIPSHGLRCGLRNLALGCVPYTRGAMCRRATGWKHIDTGFQEGLLKCPCRSTAGDVNQQPQDAVHVMLECNETDAVRHRVVAEMNMVVERGGTEEEKSTWNQLSGQRKLNYSLTTASLLPTPTEAKVKMAGARQWALGMREAADQLHRENEGYEHMVEREAALLEVAGNIGAEIEKDLEELVAIPIRYAAGPSRRLPPPEQTTGAEVLSTEAL